MWFKLAGATFTNNLGTMDSISKSYMMDYSGLTGLQASPGSVSYATDSTPDAKITFTVKSGYVFKSGSKVTASGGASKTYTASADIAAGNSFTMDLTGISGKVTFVGAAELVSSGGNTGGGEPETPVNYTFTLNPTPTSATVTLSATGYSTVSGTGSKSITVASGTVVSYNVSASGYTSQSGTQTVTSTSTKNISLSESSSSSGTTVKLFGANRTIVNSIADMSFTAQLALSSIGTLANVAGRASDHTHALAAAAGQTVTLSQPISGVTLTYALVCFNSSGATCSTEKNFLAQAWLSSSVTLPTNTAYVMIAFKRGDGSSNFSSSELAQLTSALTFA